MSPCCYTAWCAKRCLHALPLTPKWREWQTLARVTSVQDNLLGSLSFPEAQERRLIDTTETHVFLD